MLIIQCNEFHQDISIHGNSIFDYIHPLYDPFLSPSPFSTSASHIVHLLLSYPFFTLNYTQTCTHLKHIVEADLFYLTWKYIYPFIFLHMFFSLSQIPLYIHTRFSLSTCLIMGSQVDYNLHMQIALEKTDWIFWAYTRNGVLASYRRPVFNFFSNLYADIHSGLMVYIPPNSL
jgi:hypothetical protein